MCAQPSSHAQAVGTQAACPVADTLSLHSMGVRWGRGRGHRWPQEDEVSLNRTGCWGEGASLPPPTWDPPPSLTQPSLALHLPRGLGPPTLAPGSPWGVPAPPRRGWREHRLSCPGVWLGQQLQAAPAILWCGCSWLCWEGRFFACEMRQSSICFPRPEPRAASLIWP